MSDELALRDGLLPHLDRERIHACYRASPGNEIESGKFANPKSSAALAANMFGYFLDRPGDFPGIPGLSLSAPIQSVCVERSLRFPWSGGLHPWLDAVVETDSELVAMESKRFEPFRSKQPGSFSEAYLKPVWGAEMDRFQALRDALSSGAAVFERLDAVQLVKHALGLLTQASKSNKKPVLVYLYAEPRYWPDGTIIPEDWRRTHRSEIERFADAVSGDVVSFCAVSYFALLEAAQASRSSDVKRHAKAVAAAFQP
jgi:hypothetical protein